jgi:hypothetical protein
MALDYNYPFSSPSTQAFDDALASALVDPASAYPLTGVPGSQLRSVEERDHDSISAFEFMTRAQQADVKAGTALSNPNAALDVRAAIQAGIDYCQPRGMELVLPSYPLRIDADPSPPTPMQKGLRCITSGAEVPGLRIRGGGPLATRLIPTFTNGVVLEVDGAAPIYSFQRTGWLRQLSIYPVGEKAGVIGVRWAGCLHFDIADIHIQGLGSHAMHWPWRGDKGGNTYTTNPDGWSGGFFNFRLCRFYSNGGWAILQESGLGGYYFNVDNCYFLLNRLGGIFLSGHGHRVGHCTIASNGQDNSYYGFGVIIARRMVGSGANCRVVHCELDSNWAGNIWLQGVNGTVLEGNRHNSWSTTYGTIGVADKQLRPPVHIRAGGSVPAATALRLRMLYNNHRSQNVAAGGPAEGAVVWYALHDSATTQLGTIENPFNDSQSANAVRYSQGSGALFTPVIAGGAVTGYTRLSGGLGYSTVPTVTVAGGAGSGATGTAVTDGQVVEVLPTDPGIGYSSSAPPTVTISGGGGSGATATAVIDEWGQLTSCTVTNGGTGYTSTPTVVIGAPTVTGAQRQATATAAWSKVVASITLGAGGTLYDSANPPTIIIVPADIRISPAANFRFDIVDNGALVWTQAIQPWLRYRDTAGTLSIAGTGTTATVAKYASLVSDGQALYNTTTGQITIPYNGVFEGYFRIGIVGLVAGELVSIGVYESGAQRELQVFKAQGITSLPNGAGGSASDTFQLDFAHQYAKAATIEFRVLTNHGSALTTSTVAGECALHFRGTR